MDINEYFEKVGYLAKFAKEENVAVHELVENPSTQAAIVSALLAFRETVLTSEDENVLSGYLAIGFFADRTRRERLAAFAMTFEIENERKRREVKRLCKRYDSGQRLFQSVPDLFDAIRRRSSGAQDFELIDVITVSSVRLAINVYEGEDRQKRFGQSLQNVRVADASFRTHLIRVERIPFVSLFSFCGMFLESKVLLSEWFSELVRT